MSTAPHITHPPRATPGAPAERAARPALTQLPATDLETLVRIAPLQDRVDRKYLLPRPVVAALGEALLGSPRPAFVLEIDTLRWFSYQSHYFDNPALTSYRMAAHRRPNRFKVRGRSYLDSGTHFLEVKVRDRRGRTVKTRADWAPGDLDWRRPLPREARSFVETVLGRDLDPAAPLRGQLRTDYRRTTLLLPHEAARVTIDLGLAAVDVSGHAMTYGDLAVLETKTSGRPCEVDRLLWRLGHRPIRVSKYATSLAALRPGLPGNRWRPALLRLADARTTPDPTGPWPDPSHAHQGDPS